MRDRCRWAVAFLAFVQAQGLSAADWPQFRYDAARSAASPEALPAELHLQWVRHLPPPKPAFPAEVRLRFDATYEPIVLGQTMFVPSMISDSVTALDVQTGAERWRFFTEGPVRFAPVAGEGRVYFVSDDGCLYCVDAATGSLQWKFRGGPRDRSERKLLGHGRLVSLRPARGGPLLDRGIVYFGAGIWSDYGVAIHALDAKSGKPIWSNTDSNRIPKANMDHGVGNIAGLTPQGYLAIVNGKLVVPCGAQLPALLDPGTGKVHPYTMGWGGRSGLPKGTWFVAGARNYLCHGGDLYDLTRPNDERLADPRGRPDFKSMLYTAGTTRVRIDPANQKDLKSFAEPVFDGNLMYDSAQGLVALDLSEGRMIERGKAKVMPERRHDTYPDKWETHFREVWKLPSRLRLQIKAGRQLYLTGPREIQAVAIPASGEAPRVVWETTIEATPYRLIAAAGRLFAVTREGSIYAFGAENKGSPRVHLLPSPPAPSPDAWTKTAADILRATSTREGYAVVLGAASGRLTEELVRQSQLDLIVVEPNEVRASDLRKRLQAAGFYGSRASVHVGDPLAYPLPPYLASLIVCEDWAALRSGTDQFLKAIVHPLRPYGGTACVALPQAEQERLLGEVRASGIAGAAARRSGNWVLVSREGPLPRAADWTHPAADAANTGASADRFLKGPFDLLWFDGPARWFRAPGTTLVRVQGGRVYIKSERLRAVDVFTGRTLWEADLPFPHALTDQIVALDDAIYVAGGSLCLVLNPQTGQEVRRLELPAELKGTWGNLRASGDQLVAQAGGNLVCLDRQNGRVKWKQPCPLLNLSIAIGGGKVFCAELALKRKGETATNQARTRAWDLDTGKLLWEISAGSELRYCESLDLVVTSSAVYRAADGSRLGQFPQVVLPNTLVKPQNLPRPLFVIGREVLFGTGENFLLYDLTALDRPSQATAWLRRGCTVPRASAQLVTTRVLGNAACVDLATREIMPFLNVRAACSNNLFPADGVLNMPSLTGGCTCNYLPVSQAYVPKAVIARP